MEFSEDQVIVLAEKASTYLPMEENRMKPFITPETDENGKLIFPYQYEGVNAAGLHHSLQGQSILAYEMPEGHAISAAWELRFYLASSLVLEFSSACSGAGGWHEVGSLNIRLCQASELIHQRVKKEAAHFLIEDAEKLIFEDDEVIVECGLVLRGRENFEIVLAAGTSPGSVTVLAPFSKADLFQPQFPLKDCRRQIF